MNVLSLVINNGLNEGTQLPYIKKGIELGYGVLVMNTNQNYDSSGRLIKVFKLFSLNSYTHSLL